MWVPHHTRHGFTSEKGHIISHIVSLKLWRCISLLIECRSALILLLLNQFDLNCSGVDHLFMVGNFSRLSQMTICCILRASLIHSQTFRVSEGVFTNRHRNFTRQWTFMLVIHHRHLNIVASLLLGSSSCGSDVFRIVLRWHLLRKLRLGSRTQVLFVVFLVLSDALDHGNGCFLHVFASLLVVKFIYLFASLKRCSLTPLNASFLTTTLDNIGHILVGFILPLLKVGRRLKEGLIADECWRR